MISVIIPIYNRSEFVNELLDSVKKQSYRPIEVVVVDDGSEDNTESVVREWKSAHEGGGLTLRYIYQRNQGAPRARNRGFAESNGSFVQYLDSDDLLHPQKFRLQVEALYRFSEADAAWGGYLFFEDGSKYPREDYEKAEILTEVEMVEITRPGHAAHPETALYRREALLEVGPWNETLDRWQDWEYCFRVAAKRLRKVQVPGTYYFFRDHDGGKIGDLADSNDAVRICLNTLEAIDVIISNMQDPPQPFHNTAFRLYLRVLSRALTSGTREEIQECFRGIRRHSVTGERQLRVWLLRSAYKLMGGRAARAFQRAYIRLVAS